MVVFFKKFPLWILLLHFTSCMNSMESTDYPNQKQSMLNLLKARGIRDKRVLEAMSKVPRENYVLPEFQHRAYEDGPLPIGEGQTISQPYIVAYMTEELKLMGNEKVLEIGFGSGYQTAILAELAKEVYAIEIIPKIYELGKKNLEKAGYKNVFLKLGDGRTGWQEKAPFDAILAAAAPEELPWELESQLKEGGRMVIPIGPLYNQKLFTYIKKGGVLKVEATLPVRFVPMTKAKNEPSK